MQGEQKMQDSTGEALMSLNGLRYTLPQALSVVTTRTTQNYPSLNGSHSQNDTIYWRAETGARYVDARNSYVRMRVTASSACTFGTGSVMNLVRSVVVRSAAGTEIDRVQDFNVLKRTQKPYECPSEFFAKQGQMSGWETADDVDLSAAEYWYIPLADLSGIFNTGKLLPAQLMSGLQIELELESGALALVGPDDTPITYIIDQCELYLDTFQLSDSIARKLSSISATGGLELSFIGTNYAFASSVGATQTRFSINANSAVSRALNVIAVSIPTASQAQKFDSFAAESSDVLSNYQIRVGSLYFPQQPVSTARDAYQNIMHTFDKLSSCHALTAVAWDDFKLDRFLMGATLERSSVLSLSGIPVHTHNTPKKCTHPKNVHTPKKCTHTQKMYTPKKPITYTQVNQSRSLVADISFQVAGSVSRQVHLFLSYQKVVTVMLASQIVKE